MKRTTFAAATLAARIVVALAVVGCGMVGNFAAAADKAPLANYSGSPLTMKTGDTVPVANGGTGGTTASAARTNLGLGDLATQNAATPPALGGTTPAAGSFSSLKDTGITGSTQCVHADTSGNFTGTGSDCGSGGGGYLPSSAQFNSGDQSTSSTSYADLPTAGPAVTMTTGSSVLVIFSANVYKPSGGTGNTALMAVGVSGATTIAAPAGGTQAATGWQGTFVVNAAIGGQTVITGLTPGSNTFTLKYKVDGSTFTFDNRSITVIRLN